MSKSTLYPIHERFYTFQGEGVFVGQAAFFIRTFGCPLHCPWCDSAGTWHKDYIPDRVQRVSEAELTSEVVASGARIVVITGGEPTIHDLAPLVQSLQLVGKRVHLETSGTFSAAYNLFDWVTLSPKWAKAPLPEAWAEADELKLIIETPQSIEDWMRRVHVAYGQRPLPTVWLHPEWSQRGNPAVLQSIVEAVKANPGVFRAGWQMHKNYKADLFDTRAVKELIPLGGNPTLLPLT